MRRIPKYEKLILNKTYKKILKKKFGSAAGDKIFECIRSCLARGLDGDELENCVKECLKQGLLIIGCGYRAVRLLPPLDITKREIDIAVDIMHKSIKKI